MTETKGKRKASALVIPIDPGTGLAQPIVDLLEKRVKQRKKKAALKRKAMPMVEVGTVAPPEMPPKPLSPKQRVFVAEYLIDQNATQAAIRAGYAEHSANKSGPALLVNQGIAKAVADGLAKKEKRAQYTAEELIEELLAIAHANVGHFTRVDENGTLRMDFSKVTDADMRAVSEFTQESVGGPDALIIKTKIKLHPKTPANQLLLQHIGALIKKVEVSGPGGGPIQTETKGDLRADIWRKLETIGVRLSRPISADDEDEVTAPPTPPLTEPGQ